MCQIVEQHSCLLVTPNTVTEPLNLLAQHREPKRSQIRDTLCSLVTRGKELHVVSADACKNKYSRWLGLTDAALLEVISTENPVLAVDLNFYRAAVAKDVNAGINLRHLQSAGWAYDTILRLLGWMANWPVDPVRMEGMNGS